MNNNKPIRNNNKTKNKNNNFRIKRRKIKLNNRTRIKNSFNDFYKVVKKFLYI